MNDKDFASITGMIIRIENQESCCRRMLTLRTDNGIVNIMVQSETIVIDSVQLRIGMRIAAFYNRNQPMVLIFPPQHNAQYVIALQGDEQVLLSYFDRSLTASDQALQLNLSRNTEITTINGQNVTCNLGGHTLLVCYSVTTRSIPPQTTPRKIVLIC